MKFNAVRILNVLAGTTHRTEKQKRLAKTVACGASLCAHPRSRAILRHTHLSGGWAWWRREWGWTDGTSVQPHPLWSVQGQRRVPSRCLQRKRGLIRA